MPIKPVVRYMILCRDWGFNSASPKLVNIYILLTNIRPTDRGYPIVMPELCVFLALTEARGTGEGQIICVFEETGQRIFGSRKQQCAFGDDPLTVFGVPFRIRDCRFPQDGLYSVQFWYNDEKVEERPLRLR